MARLFDYYIAVDWSAKNTPSPAKPSADAIWVGEKGHNPEIQKEQYFQTRHACFVYLQKLLKQKIAKKQRVTIGFDLGFGYPEGYVDALGIEGNEPKWKKLWRLFTEMIEDGPDNKNNRFAVADQLNLRCMADGMCGPLWGHPYKDTYKSLYYKTTFYPFKTKSGHSLKMHRWTELKEPRAQPAWKLLGTASVGGQMLTGIPILYKLRFDPDLSSHSSVWPFETGFAAPAISEGEGHVCIVEIWPGILRNRLDASLLIKDQAQVRATVNWMSDLDDKSELLSLLKKPAWLSPEAEKVCIEEEGWVLGSGTISNNSTNDLNLRLL